MLGLQIAILIPCLIFLAVVMWAGMLAWGMITDTA
jgi:hypothetical protein